MKRIILDYLKRWSLIWITLGIYCLFMQVLVQVRESTNFFDWLNFSVILWISGFALNLDSHRGSGRVHLTLPVSARQIGRAWWLLSIALPTLFLALISGLALVISSSNAGKEFPLGDLAVTAITYALCFGSLFYLIGGTPLITNPTLVIRRVLAMGFLIGIIFIKQPFDTPLGIVFLLAAATMSILGWLRAEGMVRERGGFRLGVVTGTRKPGQHQAPVCFGGLPLLWKNLVVWLGYAVLVFSAWLLIMDLLSPGSMLSFPKQYLRMSPHMAIMCGYVIVLPIILQLRHLRTLPISTAKLAATLVLMAVTPVLGVGLVWAAVSGTGFQIPEEIVMGAAVAAIGVPTIVWLGLRLETCLPLTFFMKAFLLGSIFFHLKIPPLATMLGSLCVIALAYELTRRLLLSSSRAYRNAPAMFNAWGGGR